MAVASPSRPKKVSNVGNAIQLDFFSLLYSQPENSPPEYTETEKILYLLWDAVKKQNVEQFSDANRNAAYYFSGEQYSVIVEEIVELANFNDRLWILKTSGASFSIRFLFPYRHQLISILYRTDFYSFVLLVYSLLSWENS